MRKLIIVFVTISLTLFCGCAVRTQDVTSGRELGKEVLRCFDEEDSEGLKALFCEEIQNTHNLDREIAEAMKLFDGEIVSYDKTFNVAEGETIIDGQVIDKNIAPYITQIKTSTGQKLEVSCFAYIVCDKYPKRVGLTRVTLFFENEQTYTIGEVIY